jgi:predicted dehydrogenase
MKKVRFALIGVGYIGSHHFRTLLDCPRAEITLIVDKDSDRAREFAKLANCEFTSSLSDCSNFDAAIVSTSSDAHFDIAMKILNSSKPLLIEKPVSVNQNELIKITNIAKSKNIPLMTGFLERFNPAVLSLNYQPGSLNFISFLRHSPRAIRHSSNVILDLMIHDIDLLLQITGSLIRNFALVSLNDTMKSDSNIEHVDVVGTTTSGVNFSLSASRISQLKKRGLSLIEKNRLIEVDLMRRKIEVYSNILESENKTTGDYQQQVLKEISQIKSTSEPIKAQLETFVDLILNRNESEVLNMIESIEVSHLAAFEIESAAKTFSRQVN